MKPCSRHRVPEPPAEGIETIASVLNVEDDLVFNCLVDFAKIEKRALARDKESSERALLVGQPGRYSIRGRIREVYFMPKGDSWTVNSGAIGAFGNDRKAKKTIGVDKSAAIEMAKKEADQLQRELQELKGEAEKVASEQTKFQREWNHAKRAKRDNEERISSLATQIAEIKTEIETTANVTIDTSEYEEDVRQVEQSLEEIADKAQKMKEEIEKMKPGIAEANNRLEECLSRNAKVMKDMEDEQQALTQLLESQTQKKDAIAKKKEKLERYHQAIEKHEETIRVLAAGKEERLRTARVLQFRSNIGQVMESQEEGGEEVQAQPTDEDLEAIDPKSVDKDPSFYEAKINRHKEKIEKEKERKQLSREAADVAHDKYRRAMADYKAKTDQSQELKETIHKLSQDIKQRKKKSKQFQEHLAMKSDAKFSEMLNINKYNGELKFSHKDQTLDLLVSKGGSESQTKDVKGLSGGERSWSTICLLLALGESLETPFRIMDEFDVFLDAQVRKLTIEALVAVAKRMSHRQFIFITPQDVSNLKPGPQLMIHKLNPPARYDEAGGQRQQTLSFA